MVTEAEHEALRSLQEHPDQPDARNLLGVIYAREGRTARAAQMWRELVRSEPDYRPARTNLHASRRTGMPAKSSGASVEGSL
jgi:cytochrome c-type biogenesis protein CcmH/NrfG